MGITGNPGYMRSLDEPQSILQNWVTALPLRCQGTLLMALRGCDTEPKFGPTKILTRYFRYCVLNAADPRETEYDGAFMCMHQPSNLVRASEWDQVPFHWAMHMLHAIEIVGYCHYNPKVRVFFLEQYLKLCTGMHLLAEPYETMFRRLTEDRIEKGEVVS